MAWSLANFLSPTLEANVPIDQSKKSYSTQTETQTTYAPVNTYTDSRQLVLVLNSAGATTTTKKQDSTTPSSNPTQGATQNASPDLSGSASAMPSLTLPKFDLLGGLNPTNLLIGGLVVVGAVMVLRGKK